MLALRSVLAAAAVLVTLTVTAAAQTLTVVDMTGAEPVTHELTVEEVEALAPTADIATGTAWTSGETLYTGIPASAIAQLVTGPYTDVEARALNDFSVFLPLSDFEEGSGIIIATRADGALMSVRDRGPFWLMFDFDSLSGADKTAAEQRSIWQMSRLIFR